MSKVNEILQILPQTQCELCGYKGCRPYAEAIVHQGEAINRCPPGGVAGLKKLAAMTGIDPEPYLADMEQAQKPWTVVRIRESECIGCTKCIQVCPVDAIVGAAKKMHTIIETECTGCDLCIPACPVDCIDWVQLGSPTELLESAKQTRAGHFRERYETRNQRLTDNTEKTLAPLASTQTGDQRKALLAEALARKQKSP